MKKLIAMLALAAGVAHAQTYDLNVDISNIGDFSGSFVYSNGVLSSVDVFNPHDSGAFTAASYAGDTIMFLDLEGAKSVAAAGSNVQSLDIVTLQPLGSANPGIDFTSGNTYFTPDGNFVSRCGQPLFGIGPNLVCFGSLTESLHAAPELDRSLMAPGLTLLLGGIAMLRGGRRGGAEYAALR